MDNRDFRDYAAEETKDAVEAGEIILDAAVDKTGFKQGWLEGSLAVFEAIKRGLTPPKATA